MNEEEKKAVEGYDVDAAAAAAKDEAEEAIIDQAGAPIEHIIDEVGGISQALRKIYAMIGGD